MFVGISARLKDKRVDKLLRKSGYDISNCEIFYSPIKMALFFLGIFALALFPLSIYFPVLIYDYPIYFVVYFLVVYLAGAYLNNSFVLVKEKLIVINPNFPFQKMVVYDLAQIEKIKIDKSGFYFILMIFLIFGSNYIELSTANKTLRFYAIGLEPDAYDENLTEKTMDDFHAALKQHNVLTEFNFD